MGGRFRQLERQSGIAPPTSAPPSLALSELLAANRKLEQEKAHLAQILHQRSEPILLSVMDALSTVANLAAQGHPQARVIVGKWKETLALVEGIETSIIIASEIPAARG